MTVEFEKAYLIIDVGGFPPVELTGVKMIVKGYPEKRIAFDSERPDVENLHDHLVLATDGIHGVRFYIVGESDLGKPIDKIERVFEISDRKT